MHIAARMAVEAVPEGKRCELRTPTAVQTTIRALGYHGFDVIVRNISERGFMAETANDLIEGSYVRLRLPCVGTVVARIAWTQDGRVGGEFVNTVSPARLRLIPGMVDRTHAH